MLSSLERYRLELPVPEGREPLVIRVSGGLPGEPQHAQIGSRSGDISVVWREPDETLEAFEERMIDQAMQRGRCASSAGCRPRVGADNWPSRRLSGYWSRPSSAAAQWPSTPAA
jgi:hypothetical protein